MEIPIFALHAALLPEGRLALRVFEPRYLDMIGRCMREQSGFGVCLIRSGRDSGEAADIFDTGTTVRVIDWEQLKDGLLGVTLAGERKFEIKYSRVEKDQLTVAEIELLPPEKQCALPPLYQPLADFLQKLLAQLAAPYDGLAPRLDDAGWVGARLTEILPLKIEIKQRLVEMYDPTVRLEHIRLALQEKNFI